jgi:DNA-binding CsgD family transcriptional regulator
MTTHLSTDDVRDLLRLLGELRELGADPAAWRSHLVHETGKMFGAHVSVISELRPSEGAGEGAVNCAEVVTSLQSVDHGIDDGARERFYRELYFTDHETDDALGAIVPLYGTSFTICRRDVVTDVHWERSFVANERFRAFGCDDFVMSMAPVDALGVISSLELFHAPGKRFGERERTLVQLLHEELARDWNRREPAGGVRLTPRQRQVLARLAEGASEKDIAHDLGVSPYTAHDHVKALHKAFGARSRGELLARVAKRTPRTRLVAERPAY